MCGVAKPFDFCFVIDFCFTTGVPHMDLLHNQCDTQLHMATEAILSQGYNDVTNVRGMCGMSGIKVG